MGWLVYLLSHLPRRDPTLVVFGVHTGSYSGNVRALLEEDTPGLTKVFIAGNTDTLNLARGRNISAHLRYSLKGIISCLRAGQFIYSNYPSDINFWLSGGASLINVWHGTPLKKIERDVSNGRYSLRNRYHRVYKILAPYLFKNPTVILSASPYEERCFETAFDITESKVVRAFPPRLLHFDECSLEYLGKVILYAPTWRDDGSYKVTDHLNFSKMQQLLHSLDVTLVIKQHPSAREISVEDLGERIVILERKQDIYPHLLVSDLVITDYSSIIFEAFYLGKALHLFAPDQEHYIRSCRNFYIEPESDLGLSVSKTQNELEQAISEYISGTCIQAELSRVFQPYPPMESLLHELTGATAEKTNDNRLSERKDAP